VVSVLSLTLHYILQPQLLLSKLAASPKHLGTYYRPKRFEPRWIHQAVAIMSQNINTKTPNKSNPSSLKPRYEIRKLEPKHQEWANAVMRHGSCFHSSVWPLLYEDIGDRVFKFFDAATHLIQHQIDSGLSYGVFDNEYEYKTAEAKDAGGKLYWDRHEPSVFHDEGLKAEGERLLKQMDFPLVSIAMSYDGANPLDMSKMGDLINLFPQFGLIYHILSTKDTRDPESWKPTGPGQVLMRNGTATRHDYEGQGIMGGLARWQMRDAAEKGFRGIEIAGTSDAVKHVWSKVEEPYSAYVVSEFDMGSWRDEEGKLAFEPSKQNAVKCWVSLR
jgi:hypothetical protein